MEDLIQENAKNYEFALVGIESMISSEDVELD